MTARLPLDKLPPKLRKALEEADARGEDRVRARTGDRPPTPPRARPVRIPDSPVRCITCGETFPSYARAERHVDEAHGAGRIALALDPP